MRYCILPEASAKREIDSKVTEPIGWADLVALAPLGKARYSFLRDFCGVTPRFEPRWQYKAGDITLVGYDYDAMLTPPFGNTPEQIEATSWFRQNYASTGPLTGARVHLAGPWYIMFTPPPHLHSVLVHKTPRVVVYSVHNTLTYHVRRLDLVCFIVHLFIAHTPPVKEHRVVIHLSRVVTRVSSRQSYMRSRVCAK